MRKIITLLGSLLFAVSQGSFAQSTIFGKVVDAKDGSGIAGASVIVKETTIGGITNSSGSFGLMNVPNDATLQVSFVGYKTVEMEIENQTRFEIKLEQDVQALGEVVVTADRSQHETVTTAMGIERDPKTITTAAHQISGDELRSGGNMYFTNGLVGKVPGLNGYTNAMTGHFTITHIRGITSFTEGAKAPLFVLDGVPLSEDPTLWLDIELVESVTVLPSANAAILYGNEGVNGAIIITTKKW